MSIPVSQLIPPYPLGSGKHKIVSYVYNSISVLYINSLVPFS